MGWSTKTIRPLGSRVLVKLDEQQTRHGSIEIPDEWRRQQQTAVVIAVGPRHDVADVKPGDRVVIGKWNGVALPDPEDDDSGKSTPRYFMLEQASQKYRNDATTKVAYDDLYGVIEGETRKVVSEWKPPQR